MSDRGERHPVKALREMLEAVTGQHPEAHRTSEGAYLDLPRGFTPTEEMVKDALQRGRSFKLQYCAPEIYRPAQFFIQWREL